MKYPGSDPDAEHMQAIAACIYMVFVSKEH